MNPVVVKFAKRLLMLTLASGILAFLMYLIIPHKLFSLSLPFLFVFFFACSVISFMILNRSLQHKFSRFVSVFMLVTGVKLFLFVAIMIVYSFVNREDAIPFLLNFFILYLVFTVFEVTQIIGLTKSSSSAGNENA